MTTTPGPTGALAALWGADATPRPGPRPRLSVRTIAEAAVEIADADGLAAVSMARVAERLGVTPMALYRYVSSKDELLTVMADVGIPHPPDDDSGGTWRERLERWAFAQLDIARARPWLVEQLALLGAPALGPSRLAWVERGLAALDGTGLPEGLKVAVVGTLSLHVLTEGQVYAAAVQLERAAERHAPDEGAGRAQHVALLDWSAMLGQVVDPTAQPHLARALEAGAFDYDPDEGDAHGNLAVTVLLDGVAALVERFGAEHDDAAARTVDSPGS